MNLLAPVNDPKLISEFADAGVDEFYMGFHDGEWTRTFGEYADINRMSGFGRVANSCSFEDLEKVAVAVRNLGKRLYVTLNANCYDASQLDYIASNYCPDMRRMGIAGVICSDMPTAKLMIDSGLAVTVSTMAGVYNQYIAREYANLGIRRIILPRDLTIEEIKSVVTAVPEVEYEVFHMRNGCVFSDPFCLGFHRPDCGSTCSFVRHKDARTFTTHRDFLQLDSMAFNDLMYNSLFHAYACAMCAMYDFRAIGITSLKIVGRADDPRNVVSDVVLSARNRAIANGCSSREEYLSKMVMSELAPGLCRCGLSCYYPELRYGGGAVVPKLQRT